MHFKNMRKNLQIGFSQSEMCKSNQLRHIDLETHYGTVKGWLVLPNQNAVPEPMWMKIIYTLKEIKPNLIVLASFEVFYKDADVTNMVLRFNPWATIEAKCIANFEDARALLNT